MLSKPAILAQLGRGIIIHPFAPEQLKTCSYDVRLGEWYFRRKNAAEMERLFFNPYDQEMIKLHYGEPIQAGLAGEEPSINLTHCCNIDPDQRVIILQPGEMILGHTQEFIGGTKDFQTGRCFTAEMKARSSVGRVGFEVCRCAGWGDVGYVNRWTMEIVCTSPLPTILVVGTRLAQMKFYEVDEVTEGELYGVDGSRDHYQCEIDLETVVANWQPKMLLPKLSTT